MSSSSSIVDMGSTGWMPSLQSLSVFIVPGLLIGVILYLCEHQYDDVLGVPPPGPWGLPILGYLPFLDARAPHKSLQALAKRYGGIFQLRMGNIRTVFLSDVALVREFFRHEEMTDRAPLYVTHGIMGGYGIICAQGDIWKHARREVIDWLKSLGMTRRPGERRSHLEQRIGRGVNECVQLFGQEADESRNSEFDPQGALHHSLGNIINDLVFGITYARNDPDWLYLQRLQEHGVKLIGVSGVVNFLPWLRRLPSQARNIQFLLEGKAKTHAIYDRIAAACSERLQKKLALHNERVELIRQQEQLEERRQRESQHGQVGEESEAPELAEEPEEAVPSAEEGDEDHSHCQRHPPQLIEYSEEDERHKYQPHCILEHFLVDRKEGSQLYCDEQLRHLLADLYGAGVDTALATLRWFLVYMAREQACQRRLHELLLPLDATPSLEELEPLAYLRACLAETQRIRSVVPLGIPHGCERDFTVGDYRIQGGTMIVSLMWGIHMDPQAFPQPEEFRPERFLGPDGGYVAPPQFIPFQVGKRMCPGDELARMMLTLFAGRILRRFHLEVAPDSRDMDMAGESGITLTPAPYKLRFTRLPERMELMREEVLRDE
ncbi:cytochrome P450 306a1 [Drosophila serrata]|uniref:cytochrome P450 306a1 n=1 Tax=Drosophila serrata TaxID=7274 RepID=UPI000A1CF732|nr:cytochrome P450 306a1 [Drosophila serrata]